MEYSELARTKALTLLDRFAGEIRRTTEHPDADAVHDLRVSIRRLSQALDVFDGAVPARVHRKVRTSTDLILDAAGDVRDLDIARELIGDGPDERLAAILDADRAKAAVRLQRQLTKSAPASALVTWRNSVTSPKDTGEAAAAAHSLLTRSAEQLLKAGRREIEQRATAKRYHRVRLAAKRFRYQLELFRDIAPKKADALLTSVAKLQSALGDLNDAVAARKLLREYPATKKMRKAIKHKQDELLDQVHEIWRDSLGEVASPEDLLRFLDARRRPSGRLLQ